MTEQQAAALAALRPDVAVAWLVIYEDGTSAVLRDDSRSMQHSKGAHAIRVALVPVLPTPSCAVTGQSAEPGAQ